MIQLSKFEKIFFLMSQAKNIYIKLGFFVLAMLCDLNYFAQVIYTNVCPDVVYANEISNGADSLSIDLDNDGTKDYMLYKTEPYFVSNLTVKDFLLKGFNGNETVCFGNGTSFFVDTLKYGDQVSAASSFTNVGSPQLFSVVSGNVYGPFKAADNFFIGVRFNTVFGKKYGWIRLRNRITLADYAYNNIPNQPINAGDGMAVERVENVILKDVSDNGNGSDLNVTFDKAFDETNIVEYRVLVVPATSVAGFTLDSAKNVLAANTYSLQKTGSDINVTLSQTSTDVYGNLLVPLKPYALFVLSIPDLLTSSDTVMSSVSNVLTLEKKILPPFNLNIVSTKISASFYNINLAFDVSNEIGIDRYRMMILPANSNQFTIDSALLVNSTNYVDITLTSSTQSLNFTSNTLHTYNGQNLQPFKTYKVVLMAVSDTIDSYYSVLSVPSNSFVIYTEAHFPAQWDPKL